MSISNLEQGGRVTPRVTVLMCVYNGQRYLSEAIESILSQSYSAFEFLIVDDKSTDDSRDIVHSYKDPRIHVLKNGNNVGLTKSLNRGLAVTRGELIARQDADDISHRTRLEKQVAFLDAHPDVAIVGSQVRLIDQRGRVRRKAGWINSESDVAIKWQLMFDSPFVHTSAMFRRGVVWKEFGGYDERFVTSQDFALWSRVATKYRITNLPDCLIDFRGHTDSLSSRYCENNILKLREVLLSNMLRCIGPAEIPDGWPDLWIGLNNPHVFGQVTDPSRLISAMETIYTEFLKRHPEAASNQDVRKHVAGTLARIACIVVRYNRKASITLFARACRTAFPTAKAQLVKYIALLALANVTQRKSKIIAT